MNAIRVYRRLDSHVLDLPELKPMVGKLVEIIVLEEDEPIPTGQPRDTSALDALAGKDLLDADAFEKLREISKV